MRGQQRSPAVEAPRNSLARAASKEPRVPASRAPPTWSTQLQFYRLPTAPGVCGQRCQEELRTSSSRRGFAHLFEARSYSTDDAVVVGGGVVGCAVLRELDWGWPTPARRGHRHTSRRDASAGNTGIACTPSDVAPGTSRSASPMLRTRRMPRSWSTGRTAHLRAVRRTCPTPARSGASVESAKRDRGARTTTPSARASRRAGGRMREREAPDKPAVAFGGRPTTGAHCSSR